MLAKCISEKCERFQTCARAKSESTAEVNYFHLCGDGDKRWYIESEVIDSESEKVEIGNSRD